MIAWSAQRHSVDAYSLTLCFCLVSMVILSCASMTNPAGAAAMGQQDDDRDYTIPNNPWLLKNARKPKLLRTSPESSKSIAFEENLDSERSSLDDMADEDYLEKIPVSDELHTPPRLPGGRPLKPIFDDQMSAHRELTPTHHHHIHRHKKPRGPRPKPRPKPKPKPTPKPDVPTTKKPMPATDKPDKKDDNEIPDSPSKEDGSDEENEDYSDEGEPKKKPKTTTTPA